jgi:serine/threonine protein kinase
MGTAAGALDPPSPDVALKLLPESDQSDPDRMLRLVREGRAIASLDHPYIAAVHSFEETDRFQFLVLELVFGRDVSATQEVLSP